MISHVLPTYNRADIAFERGEGAWAIATDGTRYLDLGAGEVVIKNGGEPIRFGGAQGVGVVGDLERATPIDTTSAGDAFNAGYLAASLGGAGPEDAIRAGHALSRKVIAHPGALVREAVAAPD